MPLDPPRLLLTWSDRGLGRPLPHHRPRDAADLGPVIRLLEHAGPYAEVWILTVPDGAEAAGVLAAEVRERGPRAEVVVVPIRDPSDHAALFGALPPVLDALPPLAVDVLLSAGTPQAQTTWVLLVQAEILRARMLQVVPPAFVPDPHPLPVREVRLDFAGFPEIRALRAEVGRLRAEARVAGDLVGESAPMVALRARIARVAAADVPVLVHGETGTGKELVARAIHEASARGKGPYVAENCAAFEEGVLTSELFGHERGAFTGAAGRRRGLFEQAHGGTLLLDEVGEMPPRVQVMLLRVLQEGAVRRVGGERPVKVDVRVIAATHRDLAAMVRAGTFREDLWYRLRGATLEAPPLRERPGDLERLVATFLGGRPLTPTPSAWAALRAWRWPGNVRELRAEVLRWTVFCDGTVRIADLAPEIRGDAVEQPESIAQIEPLAAAVARAERRAIAAALAAWPDNLSAAARALGIDRHTLARKR
ncbi:MAG: sigma 54-interacting transcriptional regulator [Pseudomonadota bacterium]|nr:sigma 54-interacting transcriptional regulator [Pseudomonadota bacterium]